MFRRKQPPGEEPHELYVGQSGSGKTTMRARLLPEDARKGAVVIVDPQRSDQSFSERVLPIIERAGLWHRLIFETLAATTWILAWQILKPSADPNPVARAQADEDSIRALAGLVARRSGKPLHSTPMIEEWLVAAVTMAFASGAPFSLLPYCFLPDSPQFRWMLDNHRVRSQVEDRNREKWRAAAMLYRRNPRSFFDQVMHAARRVEAVFTTRFLLRCDGRFDLERALAEGKILVFQGDPDNEDATRTLLGSVIHRVIQNARDERSPRVRLIADEANNFGGLVDDYVASALATKRQAKLAMTFLVQHLNFGSDEVLRAVMTNTQAQHFLRMGDPDTARYAAMAVGIPGIDFNRVLRTTERTVRVGESEAELDGRKILRPEYGTERVDHVMSGNDQVLETQQSLMGFDPGWVISKLFGKVTKPYYVPMEGQPWRLTTERARRVKAEASRGRIAAAVRAMRSRPPFTKAGILAGPWSPPAPPPSTPNARPSPNGGDANSSPPSTSADPSRATRSRDKGLG